MSTEAELVADLRAMLADEVAAKNILNGQAQQFSDTRLKFFLKFAMSDINGAPPDTTYTLDDFPDPSIPVLGAMIFALISEGIIQARNQLDYNDAGFSISMFNKTGVYQGWASFLISMYSKSLDEFKRGVVPARDGAGFVGIRSPFSNEWGIW